MKPPWPAGPNGLYGERTAHLTIYFLRSLPLVPAFRCCWSNKAIGGSNYIFQPSPARGEQQRESKPFTCMHTRVGVILLTFECRFPHLMASSVMYQKCLGQIGAHLVQKHLCAECLKAYEVTLLSESKRSGEARALRWNISELSQLSAIIFTVP